MLIWPLVVTAARRRRGLAASLAIIGSTIVVMSQSLFGSVPAAAADPPPPGSASAQASVLSIVAQTGGAPFTVNFVEASSAYVQTETEARSATVDLGGLGFVLSELPLCGQPALPMKDQPQVLSIDSANETGTEHSPGNVGGLGTETVQASTSPEQSSAQTDAAGISLGSLLNVSASSNTKVSYDSSGQQQATATVTEDVSIEGGLIRLEGLTWQATDQSGVSAASSASFHIAGVAIGGVQQPLDLSPALPVATVIGAVNNLLMPFGFSISLPAESTGASSGKAAMSPLDLHFAGSSADQVVVGPVSTLVSGVEAALKGASTNGSDCAQITNLLGNLSNIGNTVANLALGIAQGAGGLDINLGGVNVETAAQAVYANPLESSGGPSDVPLSSAPSGSGGGSGDLGAASTTPVATGPAMGGTGDGGNAGSVTPSVTGPATTGQGAAVPESLNGTAPTASAAGFRCATTSPAGSPGCWNGTGVVAGTAAVVVAGGMLAADMVYGRRTIRRRRRRASID